MTRGIADSTHLFAVPGDRAASIPIRVRHGTRVLCRYYHREIKMDQLRDYADDRLVRGCIYCGGPEETRDHAPSRVFLESPYPENLPVVSACDRCNQRFSKDEVYVAALIECVLAGTTDPDCIRRPSVSRTLRKRPALRARIEAAKSVKNGAIQFQPEVERVRHVLVKLAQSHAAYELSQVRREEPTSLGWIPLAQMSEEQREAFEACQILELFGEVGSRGVQRAMLVQLVLESQQGEQSTMGLLVNDWVEVQDRCYRYLAIEDANGITIRIVLAECLACEVRWT